jgi:hypothetical protein
MDNQNSAVVTQIRPEQAMEQLGLKKDAYYEDLKFLGIKAKRDSDGKSYLDEGQFQLLRALRSHVSETGKRDGFEVPGELATTLGDDLVEPPVEEIPVQDAGGAQFDLESIIGEAAELAGSRMTMREQVVTAIADQLQFEDLPPEVQRRVQATRAAANPKLQPRQVATALLSQWRQQNAA